MALQVVLQKKPEITASILDSSVLEPYNESVKSYNNKQLREFLSKYKSLGTELTGSSLLMQVHLLNSGLLPDDAQLIQRQGDLGLEAAIKKAPDFLKGLYTDFGLALITPEDIEYSQNNLLAKTLAKDLIAREIPLGTGLLIPLNVLSLEEHNNSHYGAVFRLNQKATKDNIRPLGELLKWNSQRRKGLACAGLSSGRDWYSYDRYLAHSIGNGRVVVVTSKAGSQKILKNHKARLENERDKAIAEIQQKFTQQERSLRVE